MDLDMWEKISKLVRVIFNNLLPKNIPDTPYTIGDLIETKYI